MKNLKAVPDIAVTIRVKKSIISQSTIQALIVRAARAVKLKHAFAVNVQVVGPARSRMLNKQWRGKDKPTNVLSFAARETAEGLQAVDMPRLKEAVEDLGDIVICPAIAEKEAPLFEVSVREHVARLVVHGFLHLVGHDHMADTEAAQMEKLEWKIVRSK